jgi:hypothetical protein
VRSVGGALQVSFVFLSVCSFSWRHLSRHRRPGVLVAPYLPDPPPSTHTSPSFLHPIFTGAFLPASPEALGSNDPHASGLAETLVVLWLRLQLAFFAVPLILG